MAFDWPGEKTMRKMWATFEKGACGIFAPSQVKRLGKAHAEVQRHQMLTVAQTELDVRAMREGRLRFVDGKLLPVEPKAAPALLPPPDTEQPLLSPGGAEDVPSSPPASLLTTNAKTIEQRIATKVVADELQKAVNLQTIMIKAEDIAAETGDAETSDEPIEDAWFTQWREHAERVSESSMQKLWARLLHGEAQKPGSISLLTMAVLSQMDKRDAEMVSRVAAYAMATCFWRGDNKELFTHGPFEELLHLEDLGLLTGLAGTGLTYTITSVTSDRFSSGVVVGNKLILLEAPDPKKEIDLAVVRQTSAGETIFNFARREPDAKYFGDLIAHFKTKGFSVKTGDLLRLQGKSIQHGPLTPV